MPLCIGYDFCRIHAGISCWTLRTTLSLAAIQVACAAQIPSRPNEPSSLFLAQRAYSLTKLGRLGSGSALTATLTHCQPLLQCFLSGADKGEVETLSPATLRFFKHSLPSTRICLGNNQWFEPRVPRDRCVKCSTDLLFVSATYRVFQLLQAFRTLRELH